MPELGEQDVLIAVRAFGLNSADLLQMRGKYPPPPGASDILGLEVSGDVIACGSGVTRFSKGDSVLALLSGGGFAEFVQVSEKLVFLKPPQLSYEEAAAIPENFCTAYQALFLEGNFSRGDSILVHAGGSGVGYAAIQMARFFAASMVIATTRSAWKVPLCEKMGADYALCVKNQNFVEDVHAVTGGEGVNFILDFVGQKYFSQNLQVLKPQGMLFLLSCLSGATLSEPVSLLPILQKWLSVKGSTLRSRDFSYRANLVEQFSKDILPAFSHGALSVQVALVQPVEGIEEGIRLLQESACFGKVVFHW